MIIYTDGNKKYLFSVTVELENLSAGGYKTASVSFPYILPSTKYEVSFSELGNNWGRLLNVTNKNNSGLSFGYTNHFNTALDATTLTVYISY